MENKKKISKGLYIAVSAVLVLALAFAAYAVGTGLFDGNDGKDVNVSTADTVQITYSLSVIAQGEEIYSGDVTAPEGTVLFDSMLAALEKEEIEVVYENSEYGAYITAIGGHAQDYSLNLYWTFTLNGEMTMEGASSLVPVQGDKVVFTLDEVVW